MDMFEDGEFAGVVCMEVLEHVQNPFAAVAEIGRVLKPGGKVIGSTPFMLGIHDPPHDYFRYTQFGLAHLFRDLHEIEITPRNDSFQAANVLPLRIFAVGTPAEKAKLAWRWPLLRFAQGLQQICGVGINNTQATTGYFFVFEKPAS